MARENPASMETEPDRNQDNDPLRERHGGTGQPDSAHDTGVGADEEDDEFDDDDDDVDEDESESDVDES